MLKTRRVKKGCRSPFQGFNKLLASANSKLVSVPRSSVAVYTNHHSVPMEGKLSTSLFIQGIGLTILVVFIVRAIWSILRDAKHWRVRQVFPICHPADEGEILVVEVIGTLDQTLGCDCAAFNQLPANIDVLSTAVVSPLSMVSPTARVLPESEADCNQTPLKTFYNTYGGVSPRPRLI